MTDITTTVAKVVNCSKKYWNTKYGIPSSNVLNPTSSEYDSRYVYIGRRNWRVKWTFNSKCGNPYHIGKDGTREQVIEKYRNYIMTQQQQPKLLADLLELKGKILCCWCKPQSCHGDVLVELLQAIC